MKHLIFGLSAAFLVSCGEAQSPQMILADPAGLLSLMPATSVPNLQSEQKCVSEAYSNALASPGFFRAASASEAPLSWDSLLPESEPQKGWADYYAVTVIAVTDLIYGF